MILPTLSLAPVFRAALYSFALCLLVSSSAPAATITFVGVEPGTAGSGYAAQNWSNAGVAKDYDLSGNVYGTAGYYQIRPMPWDPGASTIGESAGAGNNLGITAGSNPTLYSAPVFLSSITGGAGTYVNYGGYPIFRGPDGSALYRQGSLSISVGSGPFNTPSGANTGYFGEAFSFTMASGIGANFRIGVAVDTAGAGAYAPDYVSIYNAGTGSVYSSLLSRDGTPDMTVFDVTASAGESFTGAMWQLAGTTSVSPFALITFDVSRYNLDVASGTQTNSSVLGGVPAALLKTGAGTAVLTGASTFSGATTISNGAVQLGGSGTLAGGSYSGAISLVTNSSSLAVATSSNQTLSGAISGSGALAKSANGTLTLSGSNSYSGGTTISGGRVITTSSNALGDASAAITVSGGAYLDIRTNMTRAGTVTFDGGYLATSAGAPAALVNNGGSFVLTNAAEIVAELAGTAGLTSGGTGTSVLWRSNSYSGATVVNGGTLTLNGAGALSTNTSLQVASGATFSMTGNFAQSNNVTVAGLTGAGTVTGSAGVLTVNKTNGSDTFSGAIIGGTALAKSGSGTLVLAGSNSYSGATTISAGSLRIVDGNALGSTNGGTTVNQGGVLRLTATNDSGMAVIGELVTLVGGTNTNASFISERVAAPFVPTNTFQGKIALLDDARIDSLGNSTLVLTNVGNVIESTNNADLTISGAGTTRLNSAISIGTGIMTKNGSGQIYVAGNGTLGGVAGGVTLNSGNIDLGGLSLTNASFTITGGIITNGTLTATTYNLNGGSVRANLGAGTVNAASGTTSVTNGGILGAATVNVTGGTLNLGEAGRLATNAAVTLDSGQLSLGGNESIASLAGSGGTLALGVSTLTVGSGNSASQITGGGILTKIGAMTLTLSGNNSYSGGTLLNGGWLVAGHTNAFGTGSITVGSGATLSLADYRVANLIVNNGGSILSTGQLEDVVATNGTTDIGGNNSTVVEVGGNATVNVSGSGVSVAAVSGGTLNINASGAVVTNFSGGNIAVSNGVSVALRGGSSAGVISGAGGIAKQGADKLTLSGANTYSGTTTVEAGTLVVNGSINSATTVQSGATLGGIGTVASATIQSGGTVGPGNSPGTLTITNGLTWSGGGNYNWQIFNVSGTAGQTNTWDLINVTGGTWDITGLSSTNKFNINLWSLSGLPDTTGTAAGFDATQNYSWMILASGGLSGTFNTNLFNINTSAINGTGGFVGATGLFSLAVDGNNDLFLNYTGAGAAVPEPGTYAVGSLLLALAAFARLRARARVEKKA